MPLELNFGNFRMGYHNSCNLYVKRIRTLSQKQDPTILIIDDDAQHLKIYSWILEREGYRCRTALVEDNSVHLPTNESIDLVLLDYRLKGSITAVDIAKTLREKFPSAPIFILSELPWMSEDIRPHAAGFISKGDPKHLIETLADFLSQQFSA